MLCYRLGTVNGFHWGFKPDLSYSKPYTFSTYLEKKKKYNLIYIYSLQTGHLEAEHVHSNTMYLIFFIK